MRSSCLRWICSIFVLTVCFFYSQTSFAQNVDAADLGASNEFIYKLNNQKVYSMRISATLGDATLTQLTSQPTTGTYTATDIPSFSLYYNNVNDFSSATLIGTSTSSGNGTTLSFTGLSQVFPGDGAYRYLFIAANVSPTAVTSRTFGFNFFSAPNFSWTTAVNVSASLGGSGKKTIQSSEFVTTWNTTNSGIGNDRIFLNMSGAGLNYTVSYQDVNNAGVFGTFAASNAPSTFIFPSPGTYQVVITGTFSQIVNGGNLDAPKLLSVDHWGTRAWSSMSNAFSQCSNVRIKATDSPNLTVATNLSQMFEGASSMNDDLSAWNVSNITDMHGMFALASSFNQDISSWNVSNVANMTSMFSSSTSFDQPLNSWDVGSVTDMHSMFARAYAFNQSLSSWNVSSVTRFESMFFDATSFNQPLNIWDLSSADLMSNMFDGATAFNGDISNWDVSNATNMYGMFANTSSFNIDISSWNIGNVTYAASMFNNATAFNQNINGWDISELDDLNNMFAGATAFNQPLNSWDVSNVLTMSGTFDHATSFNQDITGWNTGNAEDMSYMFRGANSFNQDISSWDVRKVNNMNYMFSDNLAFDQDLGSWNIDVVSSMDHMFDYSALSVSNYDNALTGWAGLSTIPNNVTLGAAGKKYCSGEDERNDLINIHGWIITDAGKLCSSNPVITLFSPVSGLPGTTVTIVGLNFNTNASDNAVYFGAVRANVVSATSTKLVVEVPAGATSVAPIIVQDLTNGLQANSLVTVSGNHARQFTVTYSTPKALKYKLKTQPINPGAQVNAVAIADFNNDGNPDFATANSGANSVSIVLGSGSGGFAVMPQITLSNDPWSITVGDFNNDGNIDFLTASPVDDCMLNLALGNGDGTFGTPVNISGGGCSITAVAADFNNDGNLDVIAGNNSSFPSRILLGDGTGNLTITATAIPSITQAHAIAVGDYNGDGIADLAIEDLTNMYIRLGVGDGTFTIGSTLTPGDTPYSIATGDFNNDGILDLAEANNISNDVYTFLGDGSGGFSFSTFITLPSGAEARSVNVGDFNGDGNADLAVANTSINSMSIALGDGTGAFSTPVTFNLDAASLFPNALASADFDKDGKADLVTGNSADVNIFLYHDDAFVTKWKTTDGHIVIQHGNGLFNYDVTWTNLTNAGQGDGSATVTDGGFTTYTISGLNNNDVYQVEITGTFPHLRTDFSFTSITEAEKLLSIENWGDIAWESMERSFYNCINMTYNATDNPDLSNVTNMHEMFYQCHSFNGNLNRWNTSAVTDMSYLFFDVPLFNSPLNNWDVSNVSNMEYMFTGNVAFNGDVTTWDVSNVNNMEGMFSGALVFNQDVGGWDVSNVTNMISLFSNNHLFNQDLSTWNVSNVTNMRDLFWGALLFNSSLNNWDVSNVTNMQQLFSSTSFNQPLNNWDVGNVTNMLNMFYLTPFNQDISGWDVSNVTDMRGMFFFAGAFNQDLNNWNVSQVTNMSFMFNSAGSFSSDLNNWDVSEVTNMSSMFVAAGSFNSDITSWNTAQVNNMQYMFYNATAFNHNLASWDVRNVTNMQDMFFGMSSLTSANYDNILIGWAAQSGLQNNVPLGAGTKTYCAGESARAALIASHSWIITDGGKFCGPIPVVTSFTPAIGGTGTTVTITGTAFTGATSVTFGGTNATSFTVVSSTSITAVVGSGATGVIAVTTPSGTGSSSGTFTFIPAPTITSFTPTSAANGVTVTITGTNFTGVTAVTFGGTNATSFTIDLPTQITAIVANGSSGNVALTGPGGTGTSGGFIFIGVPSIASFTPASAPTGTTVTITGTNFTGATSVTFGGTAATSFTVVSPTSITAVVGSGTTGTIAVITPGGTATSSGTFTFIPAPTITSFTPTSAANGTTVTITGTNFTGATSVTFGGTAATSFTVVSPTSITAVVGSGATGTIAVTTPGGTATSSGSFTFVPSPTITSFTPTSAANGATVTITGTNFTGAASVTFGGTTATSFTVVSSTSITAVVGGGTTGTIAVTTPGGTATSSGTFTFIPAPTITSFTPTGAANGAVVTITGTDFTGATSVTFGGTAATSFNVVSSTSITAVVGSGTTGTIEVITPGGTATSSGSFTFVPSPTITSFTPTSAAIGTTVTITGTDFTGATSVSFGGTAATSFTVVSSTSITAVVANGTSGDVQIITPGGTAILAGFTFTPAATNPIITSFTPTNAATGATVTITGSNFTGSTSVTFGGTNATSFTVVSATSITAVVANGTSGNVSVTTPTGTALLAGFTFITPTAPVVVVKDGDNNSGNPVPSQPNQAIDLGQTFQGKDIIKAFTIENAGTSDLQITSITIDNSNFEITEQPTVIAPNSFARLAVRLKAEQIGNYSARIAIQYQSGSFEFNVTGEVKDPAITVYNAVTPNGDGNHDFLKIINIELYPENSVTIINRLGEPVFKMKNYNNNDASKRFNGEGNTGGGSATLTDGTYYYIIDIGAKDNHTGFLLLQK